MNFIAHNILLDNKQKTIPNSPYLIAENSWWRAAKKTINLFIKEEDKSQLRTVDLGCLEGGYAVEFARMGFQSLGIEAREENISKCNYVKQNLNLPNLSFVKDDVRNLPNYGAFDVTFCYGLLYHLDDPASFLKTMGDCTKKILLLHTHFALENDYAYDLGISKALSPIQKRLKFLDTRRNYKLSKITTNEGYKGRWYGEWQPNADKQSIEKNLEASYNNPRSFWPTKKELTKMMHAAGFDSVFEQFDFTGDTTTENYTEYNQRTMFVGIKH
ncbi:MAG TPA: class I SAM-dependent methyltransferase [Flavisolibacter sp.]